MRFYWKVMTYGCDRCGQRIPFYLEDGCEGPRDGGCKMYRLPDNHPFDPGKEVECAMTRSGRLVLPVPFMAGGCPNCQPISRGRWSMRPGAGVLSHIDWQNDREHYVTDSTLPHGVGAFWYPREPEADQACGVPIFPDELMRGVVRESVRNLVAV
jgi:hypothetical protein